MANDPAYDSTLLIPAQARGMPLGTRARAARLAGSPQLDVADRLQVAARVG